MIEISAAALYLSIGFSAVGLVAGLIAFLTFVSERPTRAEMLTAIEASVSKVAEDVKYIRDRIDGLDGPAVRAR